MATEKKAAKVTRDKGCDADFTVYGADKYPVWLTVSGFSIMLKDDGDGLAIRVFGSDHELVAELYAEKGVA